MTNTAARRADQIAQYTTGPPPAAVEPAAAPQEGTIHRVDDDLVCVNMRDEYNSRPAELRYLCVYRFYER